MAFRPFAILDPAAGISGDMLLGALLDIGAPREWLESLPARLGFPEVRIEVDRVTRAGIACSRVMVRLGDGRTETDAPAYAPAHSHEAQTPPDGSGPGSHRHHHPHQPGDGTHHHLSGLLGIIEGAPFSSWVRERAALAIRLLCEAEGRVHGVPAETVALHEVGAVDAIVDICGGIEGFEQLGIDRIHTRAVALGSGWVHAAHGAMHVPAPATLELLTGLEVGTNGPVTGEATTPTGAVLLRVLVSGPMPARYRALRNGWGAGTRDPAGYPNALRVTIAEAVPEAGQVVTVSSDLDDFNPEFVQPLREALMAAGALDVQVWATQMKKGRPGFRIEAQCDIATTEAVTEAFFVHSTTVGVRRTLADRVTLARRHLTVPASDGTPISVKVVEAPGGPRVKAEFEEVRRAAARLGRAVHEVARDVESKARALLAETPAGASRSPKER